jgi:hypothetical protein
VNAGRRGVAHLSLTPLLRGEGQRTSFIRRCCNFDTVGKIFVAEVVYWDLNTTEQDPSPVTLLEIELHLFLEIWGLGCEIVNMLGAERS